MSNESSQHRNCGVRPPRVQITYDVEDGDAVDSRELPMVVGVLSDLSGDSTDSTQYAERSFEDIRPGGVDKYMARLSPTLSFDVSDAISGEKDAQIKANLNFNSLDDFSPMGVASQLPQTMKLLEARRQLADLYGKVEANDTLDGILGEVLADADKRNQLKSQLDGLDADDQHGEDD